MLLPNGKHWTQFCVICVSTNIQGCLDKLKLSHEDWDWQNSTKVSLTLTIPRLYVTIITSDTRQPQAKNYKKWLKGQLINQHPVVWMIMCKGDSHQGSRAFQHFTFWFQAPLSSSMKCKPRLTSNAITMHMQTKMPTITHAYRLCFPPRIPRGSGSFRSHRTGANYRAQTLFLRLPYLHYIPPRCLFAVFAPTTRLYQNTETTRAGLGNFQQPLAAGQHGLWRWRARARRWLWRHEVGAHTLAGYGTLARLSDCLGPQLLNKEQTTYQLLNANCALVYYIDVTTIISRYQPGPSLYRAFHTLEDSTRMDGNCAIAQSGWDVITHTHINLPWGIQICESE